MPLSMTGYGEAHRRRDDLAVVVEARTINNRYFKLSLRITEGYAAFEPAIESLVRERIRRGTVQVNVRADRAHSADDYRVNAVVLNGYRRQLEAIGKDWTCDAVRLDALLPLPGVIEERAATALPPEEDWALIRDTLQAAMDAMDRMRADEGRAMAADLTANCRIVALALDAIVGRAPLVAEGYRQRLEERIGKLLAEYQITLSPGDLIREVGLFSERCDISEEIVRLRSHLEQFAGFVESPESNGRKLEFLTQEMFREANTIGSKSNDVGVAHAAVEIKTSIERMREIVANVE